MAESPLEDLLSRAVRIHNDQTFGVLECGKNTGIQKVGRAGAEDDELLSRGRFEPVGHVLRDDLTRGKPGSFVEDRASMVDEAAGRR